METRYLLSEYNAGPTRFSLFIQGLNNQHLRCLLCLLDEEVIQ